MMRIDSDDDVSGPFVDGAISSSSSDRTLDVVNPSTGQIYSRLPVGCEADANLAVSASRRAFEDGRWSEMAPSLRKAALQDLASRIERDSTTLDALDAVEMGKPVSLRLGNAAAAAALLRFYAESVDKIVGDVYTSDKHSFVAQRRVPRGVVAAITPWNFPTYNVIMKIAPALAAGNCVVLKPSELASRSALRLARLAIEAGIPPGVFNVVPGCGETVGRTLGLHQDVDMLTFTGSTVVGRLMLQYAGQSNLKVVMAECGGKSPQIVFDDGVDLTVSADAIASFLLTNQGQICSVGSRLLVHQPVEAEVLKRIRNRITAIVMGDALNPNTTFGPLASERQCARVVEFIDGARSDGAELVAGGRQVLRESGGYFVEPTILRNVQPEARIGREEVFGPVLAVIPFRDEADAIRIANSTSYGLSAYVWTGNLSRGMRMMKAIRSSVRINAGPPVGEGPGHAASNEPAGQSGVGTEGGLAGLESYLRRQRVWFTHE